jgi:hypothetical protein
VKPLDPLRLSQQWLEGNARLAQASCGQARGQAQRVRLRAKLDMLSRIRTAVFQNSQLLSQGKSDQPDLLRNVFISRKGPFAWSRRLNNGAGPPAAREAGSWHTRVV